MAGVKPRIESGRGGDSKTGVIRAEEPRGTREEKLRLVYLRVVNRASGRHSSVHVTA